MALKQDRSSLQTDISFFMNETAERGGMTVYDTAGSGAAMDQGSSLVTYSADPSGKIPVGLLINDVVDSDLSRRKLQSGKADQSPKGGKVCLVKKGWVVTNDLEGTPSGGDLAYLGHSGKIATPSVAAGIDGGSDTVVGRFLSSVDEKGYAKVGLELGVKGNPATSTPSPSAATEWERYEELLTSASGSDVIERKEFRDGLGAVVKDNSTTINLTGSRVDDNGVLRVVGGCATADWNLQQLEDWMEVVHGLWSQTHFKDPGSSTTEPAINDPGSNTGESSSSTWGFTTQSWTGAPTDDFGFQYAYTVDTTADTITLTDFPTLGDWDTTDFAEYIQFETIGAGTIPANDQGFTTGTTYTITDHSSGPNGTFNVSNADWTGTGTADGRYINTPFAEEVYLVEWTGDVTYETCNFRIHTRGDYGKNTTAEVRYKRTGTTTWYRAVNARQTRGAQTWETYRFNISGCIMRLSPNTEYDIQITLNNSNGVYANGANQGGSYIITSTFRTRQRPVLPTGGTTHNPTTLTEIRQLLGCTGAGGTPAAAGDIINIPTGDFSDKTGTNRLEGISIVGTELNPIYIQGQGNTTELPRMSFATVAGGVNWLIFDNFRVKNWRNDLSGDIDTFAIYGPSSSSTSDSYGITFTRVEIKNPDIQNVDIHALADSGERYDSHGGFFTGGNNGETNKWWNIEDCTIFPGYYPNDARTGFANFYWGHEGWDMRTTSTVIQWSDWSNFYENSFTHTGGSGGQNLVLHNEVHHNNFYALYDDLFESDESDGGHVIHHNKANHGMNTSNTNLEGGTPATIGNASNGYYYNSHPRYYGEFTITSNGVVNGYDNWDLTTSPSVAFNNTDSSGAIQQRNYQLYTLSGGDTFTANNHGFSDNDRVVFIGSQNTAIPTGLNEETYATSSGLTTGNRPTSSNEYYVINSTTNTFQVSLTEGGSAVSGLIDTVSAGRYVADRFLYTWTATSDWTSSSCKISTRMSGSYPTRTEYQNTNGPDQDFPILICTQRRGSSFSGYRIISCQSNVGSVPHWLVNNQFTGMQLVNSPDGVYKIKTSGASVNMIGNIACCQYQWSRAPRLEANASQYWTNSIYLQESSGYFSTTSYKIGDGPTSGTTGSPIATRYTYWDRNAWFNADVDKNLLGQSSVPNMYTAYLIDQNGHEILSPVTNDLLNMWNESDVAAQTPLPGNFGDSDYGTKENMIANQSGSLYGEGANETDLPGIDNLQGPYITLTDSSNLSFMTTKTENRRDIGPNQVGLPTPRGRRSYTDFLSYVLPDGWEVKASGTDYTSLGVTTGTGTERIIIGKTDNSAAILIEHEEF